MRTVKVLEPHDLAIMRRGQVLDLGDGLLLSYGGKLAKITSRNGADRDEPDLPQAPARSRRRAPGAPDTGRALFAKIKHAFGNRCTECRTTSRTLNIFARDETLRTSQRHASARRKAIAALLDQKGITATKKVYVGACRACMNRLVREAHNGR